MNKKIVLALSLLFAVTNVTFLTAQDAAQVVTSSEPAETIAPASVGNVQTGKTTKAEPSIKTFWQKYRLYILIGSAIALGLVFLQTRREN